MSRLEIKYSSFKEETKYLLSKTKEKFTSFSARTSQVIYKASTAITLAGAGVSSIQEGVTSIPALTFSGLTVASAAKDIWQYKKDKKKQLEFLRDEEDRRKKTSISSDLTSQAKKEYNVKPLKWYGFKYKRKVDRKRALALLRATINTLDNYSDNSGENNDPRRKIIYINPIRDVGKQPESSSLVFFYRIPSKGTTREMIQLGFLGIYPDNFGNTWRINQKIDWVYTKQFGIPHVSLNQASQIIYNLQDRTIYTRIDAISNDEVEALQQGILSNLPQAA